MAIRHGAVQDLPCSGRTETRGPCRVVQHIEWGCLCGPGHCRWIRDVHCKHDRCERSIPEQQYLWSNQICIRSENLSICVEVHFLNRSGPGGIYADYFMVAPLHG